MPAPTDQADTLAARRYCGTMLADNGIEQDLYATERGVIIETMSADGVRIQTMTLTGDSLVGELALSILRPSAANCVMLMRAFGVAVGMGDAASTVDVQAEPSELLA